MSTPAELPPASRRRDGRSLARLLLASLSMVATLAAGPVRAAEPVAASLRLDWLPTGYQAPFFLAVARGYFREEGLALEIHDGTGSAATLQAVASGADTFGLANVSSAALAVGHGASLLAVACIIQKMPDAILSLAGSGIASPKDLEGKRWAFLPDDAGARVFPLFAAANHVDMGTIKQSQANYASLYTILLRGDVDFIIGWPFADGEKLSRRAKLAPPLGYADHGLNLLGLGIVVDRGFASGHPDEVRGFLRAMAHGFGDAAAEPGAAIDAMAAARPLADRALLAASWAGVQPYLHTASSAGHPIGWIAEDDWTQTAALLTRQFGARSIGTTPVFTNDYLPTH